MITVINGAPGTRLQYFAHQLGGEHCYCFTDYSLPRVDLGIIDTVEYKRPYECIKDGQALTGTFSKVFIEQLSKDFDVRVLNIIRHPTVSYVINSFDVLPNEDLPMGLEGLTPLNTSSVLDAITLSKLDSVTTIRFEDILLTGKYIFDNVEYTIPTIHKNHNNVITIYECLNYRNKISASSILKFNELFSNFNSSFVNAHNDSRLPTNVFDLLDYTPLTYEEIFK
jgi:hypothetical protein